MLQHKDWKVHNGERSTMMSRSSQEDALDSDFSGGGQPRAWANLLIVQALVNSAFEGPHWLISTGTSTLA